MGFRLTMTVVGMENDSGGIKTKNDSGELLMEPTVVGLRPKTTGMGFRRTTKMVGL